VSLFSFALWIGLMAWAATGRSDHPMIQKFVGNPHQRGRLFATVGGLLFAGVAMSAWSLNLI
jgi:hypothetical protein